MRLNKKGITLVEVLAVLVILGILATVATVAIGKIIENSRTDACAINRNSAVYVINRASNFEGTLSLERAIYKVKEELNALDKLCSAGGVYQVNQFGGRFAVFCDKHGGSTSDVVTSNISKIFTLQKFKDYFSRNNVNDSDELDSTGPNFGRIVKTGFAKILGVSEDSFDFKVVRGQFKDNYKVYMFDSLATKNLGDTLTANAYTFKKSGDAYTLTEESSNISGKVGEKLVDGKINIAVFKPDSK